MAEIYTPKSGEEFAVEMAPGRTVDDMRQEAKRLCGLDIHIRVKIGPLRITPQGEGVRLNCPIAVVDDPFLQGQYNRFPRQPGHILLIGYFK